jgi:putative ABC transport system substrate-binding protein
VKRREFITLLGAAAVWPFAARAQQSAMPVIGYLTGASMTGEGGFKQGLQETGLIEGRDFQIEHRSTAGQMVSFPRLLPKWWPAGSL